MTLREYIVNISSDKEMLEEGIRFFKNSKKMLKLASNIEKAEKDNHKISTKVRDIAVEMGRIEEEFSSGKNKEASKAEYGKITSKYSMLLRTINNEELLSGLKAAGVLASVVLATLGSYWFIVTNQGLATEAFGHEFKKETGADFKGSISGKDGTDYSSTLSKEGDRTGNEVFSNAGSTLGLTGKIFGAFAGVGTLGVFGLVKLFKMALGKTAQKKNTEMYKLTSMFLAKVEGAEKKVAAKEKK